MLHSEEEYLHFYCGVFALLLPLNRIAKIAFFGEEHFPPSLSFLSLHGKQHTAQHLSLPYIDLRIALGSAPDTLLPPIHIITLRNNANAQPVALLAIDDIEGFITPNANEWHQEQGINDNIDIFFDRLYANKTDNTLMLSLGNTSQWLDCAMSTTAHSENHHAH